MRKRFLFMLSFLIAIIFVAAGGVYLFSWQKEKVKQRAFALPAPNPQLKWTETKNSKNDWGLYLIDLKTGDGEHVSLNGTTWIYNKLVENENMYVQKDNFFSNVNVIENWFESNNWISKANIGTNEGYLINVNIPMGVGSDTTGYLKVWSNKVRVVYWSTYTNRAAYATSKPPYPKEELNYPFTVEYKIFISDIVPIEDIIK